MSRSSRPFPFSIFHQIFYIYTYDFNFFWFFWFHSGRNIVLTNEKKHTHRKRTMREEKKRRQTMNHQKYLFSKHRLTELFNSFCIQQQQQWENSKRGRFFIGDGQTLKMNRYDDIKNKYLY